MSELEHTPIHEGYYNYLKQGVKDWIEQDLGWKREDIMSVDIKYEAIKTNASDEEWERWRRGQHVDVTLENMSQEEQHQRFVWLDDENWQKKVEEQS